MAREAAASGGRSPRSCERVAYSRRCPRWERLPARTRTCCSAAGCSSRSRDERGRHVVPEDRHEVILRLHDSQPGVDPPLQRDVPLPDPDSVREREEGVVRSASRSGRSPRLPTSTVSSHMSASARPLVEGEQRVREARPDEHLGVRVALLQPAVVDRPARRRDLPPADVAQRLDRRVVLDEQPPVAL